MLHLLTQRMGATRGSRLLGAACAALLAATLAAFASPVAAQAWPAAGKAVTVRVTALRVQVLHQGVVVADHLRQFGRDKTIYDPWHYLAALERKPGALRNGAPFQNWQLPPAMRQIQAQLMVRPGGDGDFVDILRAARQHGLEIAESACQIALQQDTTQAEVVLNLIARQIEPPAVPAVKVPDGLTLRVAPLADCSRYDGLRREVSHAGA